MSHEPTLANLAKRMGIRGLVLRADSDYGKFDIVKQLENASNVATDLFQDNSSVWVRKQALPGGGVYNYIVDRILQGLAPQVWPDLVAGEEVPGWLESVYYEDEQLPRYLSWSKDEHYLLGAFTTFMVKKIVLKISNNTQKNRRSNEKSVGIVKKPSSPQSSKKRPRSTDEHGDSPSKRSKARAGPSNGPPGGSVLEDLPFSPPTAHMYSSGFQSINGEQRATLPAINLLQAANNDDAGSVADSELTSLESEPEPGSESESEGIDSVMENIHIDDRTKLLSILADAAEIMPEGPTQVKKVSANVPVSARRAPMTPAQRGTQSQHLRTVTSRSETVGSAPRAPAQRGTQSDDGTKLSSVLTDAATAGINGLLPAQTDEASSSATALTGNATTVSAQLKTQSLASAHNVSYIRSIYSQHGHVVNDAEVKRALAFLQFVHDFNEDDRATHRGIDIDQVSMSELYSKFLLQGISEVIFNAKFYIYPGKEHTSMADGVKMTIKRIQAMIQAMLQSHHDGEGVASSVDEDHPEDRVVSREIHEGGQLTHPEDLQEHNNLSAENLDMHNSSQPRLTSSERIEQTSSVTSGSTDVTRRPKTWDPSRPGSESPASAGPFTSPTTSVPGESPVLGSAQKEHRTIGSKGDQTYELADTTYESLEVIPQGPQAISCKDSGPTRQSDPQATVDDHSNLSAVNSIQQQPADDRIERHSIAREDAQSGKLDIAGSIPRNITPQITAMEVYRGTPVQDTVQNPVAQEVDEQPQDTMEIYSAPASPAESAIEETHTDCDPIECLALQADNLSSTDMILELQGILDAIALTDCFSVEKLFSVIKAQLTDIVDGDEEGYDIGRLTVTSEPKSLSEYSVLLRPDVSAQAAWETFLQHFEEAWQENGVEGKRRRMRCQIRVKLTK